MLQIKIEEVLKKNIKKNIVLIYFLNEKKKEK